MDDDERIPENEGVRLIGADEAAEALERDDTVRRRRGDEPRFGDRPSVPDAGPGGSRPTIRFPLGPDEEARPMGETWPPPRVGDDTALPHWTEPPTGEVPRIFAAEDLEEEAGAWSGFSSGQPRWRGEGPDSDESYDDFSRLADDETRVGALANDDGGDPDDFFSFEDESDERWDEEAEPALVGGDEWYEDDDDAGGLGTRTISSDPRRAAPSRRFDGPSIASGGGGGGSGAGRDVPMAIGVGVVLGVAALAAFAAGPKFAVVLVAAVLAVAAVELFNVLRQAGYQPAILLGTAACVTLPLAAYYKGEAGLPAVLFLTVVFGMAWYLAGAGGEDRPVIGLSSTLLGVGWVGVLGSFAALMLVLPITKDGIGEPGVGVLLVAILGTVGYDLGGFAIGRNAGRTPLSAASPNKTVEGLAGGCIAAVLVTVIACAMIAPFSEREFLEWILLGLGVAIAAPVGDLCESLIKRDLDVKDMGTILPGHGGFLDRFDALLFVLPTVYYLARILLY